MVRKEIGSLSGASSAYEVRGTRRGGEGGREGGVEEWRSGAVPLAR